MKLYSHEMLYEGPRVTNKKKTMILTLVLLDRGSLYLAKDVSLMDA